MQQCLVAGEGAVAVVSYCGGVLKRDSTVQQSYLGCLVLYWNWRGLYMCCVWSGRPGTDQGLAVRVRVPQGAALRRHRASSGHGRGGGLECV